MFGYAAFAEAPFASLAEAGIVYDVSISESATGAVTFTAAAVFATEFTGSASAIASVAANTTFESDVLEDSSVTSQTNSGVSVVAAILESITNTDAIIATQTYSRLINESAAGEVFTFGDIAFSDSVVESATATDAQVGYLLVERSVADGGLISALPGSTPIIVSAFTDTATGTDTVFSVPNFSTTVLETAEITGVVPTIATLNPIVSVSTLMTDTTSASTVFVVVVQEVSTIVDSIQAAFLWNIINDIQSVEWQNLNTSDSASWQVVNTSETTTWQTIKTSR